MKTVNQILEAARPTKQVENPTTVRVEPEKEKEFVRKHKILKTDDVAGNGDDVFKASNISTTHLPGERHGYSDAESKAAYEEVMNIFSEETIAEESKEASKHYKVVHADILDRLDEIKLAVKKHKENCKGTTHWGHVGDLNHIHDRLREIHQFASQSKEGTEPLAPATANQPIRSY